MYRFLFGNAALTLDALDRYSAVGSFQEGGGAFNAGWHYTGTFWGSAMTGSSREPTGMNFCSIPISSSTTWVG